MIDSTIVLAHVYAAGHGKQHSQALGRGEGIFSTKIYAKVDALGNSLQFIIATYQTSKIPLAEAFLCDAQVIADKVYGSLIIRKKVGAQNNADVIPSKSNSIIPVVYDKVLYKERRIIECFFSKIKYLRMIFSRFDKSARNFLSFVSLGGPAYVYDENSTEPR